MTNVQRPMSKQGVAGVCLSLLRFPCQGNFSQPQPTLSNLSQPYPTSANLHDLVVGQLVTGHWSLVILIISLLCLLTGCSGRAAPRADGTPLRSVPDYELLIPQFADRAEALGIRFRHDNGSSGRFYYPEIVGPGCALFDYDNDGWLDVYLVQGAPLPGWNKKTVLRNALFKNLRGRGFKDVTEQAGVSGIRHGKKTFGTGCAVGDYDNDGDLDLYLCNFGGDILYRNNGNGTFSDVTEPAGIQVSGFGSSAAFFDCDNDGDLDLFVCQYIQYHLGDDFACGESQKERDYCPPGFFPPSRSRLYRNNGNGAFTDVTQAAGITSAFNKALGIAVADFDGDGDEDVYITCDLTPNLLYINQGNGTFKERAVERGVAVSEVGEPQASMGVDFRDYDNDLRPDLIVTNYWMENNNLFRNLGDKGFTDASYNAGLATPSLHKVGWGTALRDFNNDGLRDCFVVNGHVLLHPEETTPGATTGMQDQLFLNRGGGQFRDVSAKAGAWFQQRRMGRGAAFGDVDNDGDIDVLVAHNNDSPALLINEGGNKNNWLQVELRGRKGKEREGRGTNRCGIGAKVFVTVGGKTVYEEVQAAYSFASANDLRAHFGLGQAQRVDKVKVRWLNGRRNVLTDVRANQTVTVVEGKG